MKTKLRKTYNLAVRLFIFVFAAYFLYDQIFRKNDILSLLDDYKSHLDNHRFLFNLFLVLVLSVVNLSIETEKWRFLISKLERVSFINAFKAVLTGISVSMFLPNRTGDYLGRVFILKKADRLQATLSTILGSFAQLITTILFGMVAMTGLYPYYFNLDENLYLWGFIGLIISVLILSFLIVFAYVEFYTFTDILKKITGKEYKRIKKYAQVFSWYKTRDLFRVLLLSMVRYIVFSFQFYLLIRSFGIEINYFHAMLLIGMIYLVMTIIPTIALSEIGVRGSVSIYIFKWWLEMHGKWTGDAAMQVLTASVSLWFFNIALPALVGTVFIFSLRFFRKDNTAVS